MRIESTVDAVMDREEKRFADLGRLTRAGIANFTTLKHMAHNLIRKAPGKDSLRLKRKTAAWDDDFLASLIAA